MTSAPAPVFQARGWGRWRAITLTCVFIGVLAGAVWIAVLGGLEGEFQREILSRDRENGNLAHALQEHNERILLMVDRALQRARRMAAQGTASTQALAQIAEDTDLLGDELILLAISDADGRIIRQTLDRKNADDNAPIRIDDRDYFTAMRDAPESSLRIGVLPHGHRIARPIMVLSRRLSGRDGRFAGVALAIIDTSKLTEVYERADLGSDGMVALARDDGMPIGLVIDGKASTPPAHRMHNPLVQHAEGSVRGHYRIHSHMDGVERLYSYQHFSRLPLLITVGSSIDSLEAGFAARRRDGVALASAFTLLLVAGGAFLVHAWRRQITSTVRDDARRQFLASVSHEIRTPMNGVLGMSEMLLEETLTPRQREMLRTIQQSASELLHLVDDILDFSRIEARRLRIERVAWSPVQLLDDCIALLKPAAERKGLRCNRVVGLETPQQVWGDPHRVRQIVLNLGANAIKFTDHGTVALHLSARHVGEGLCVLRFDVVDTGIGIAAGALDRMFDVFTQADESPTRRAGGAGLGLAISRDLARLMGGDISVRSRPGQGSRFRLTLPAEVVAATAAPAPGAASSTTGQLPTLPALHRSPRVLVVEDNPVNQQVACAMLASLGCRVTLAHDGQEAIEALAYPSFDLVFMDCFMPRMDGFAATRHVRQREWGTARHVPIIALTASASEDERRRCLDAGMDDYLAKPYRKSTLLQLINRYLPAERP